MDDLDMADDKVGEMMGAVCEYLSTTGHTDMDIGVFLARGGMEMLAAGACCPGHLVDAFDSLAEAIAEMRRKATEAVN